MYTGLVQRFVALSELDVRDCWFQQGNATCCTANETINTLRGFSGDRLISKTLATTLPGFKPAISFFFGGGGEEEEAGHLKERAY